MYGSPEFPDVDVLIAVATFDLIAADFISKSKQGDSISEVIISCSKNNGMQHEINGVLIPNNETLNEKTTRC